MSAPHPILPFLLGAALLLAACDQPINLTPVGGTDFVPVPSLRAADAPHVVPPAPGPDRLVVSVEVTDFDGEPLHRVEVCAWSRPEVLCTMTDELGHGWLDGPGKSLAAWAPMDRITAVGEAEGYLATVRTGVLTDEGRGALSLVMYRPDDLVDMLRSVDVVPDLGQSHLMVALVQARAPAVGLAGIAIRESNGHGVGPFYAAPSGDLKSGYVRTTERGEGVIIDLPDGVAEIRLAREIDFACYADGAAPGRDPRGLQVLMLPGAITQASATCWQ